MAETVPRTSTNAGKLSLQSTVTLSSGNAVTTIEFYKYIFLLMCAGYAIPLLGLGVYQNYSAKPSVLDALKVGYRKVIT